MRAPVFLPLLGFSLAALAPRAARAQAAPPPAPATPAVPAAAAEPPGECFGFSFGAWSPALDWRAAGHGADAPGVRLAGEFASRDSAGGAGALILFPSWWPAGVGVQLPRSPRARGDTVAGLAQAFVADGRLRSPRASVRAWLKPCAGGAR